MRVAILRDVLSSAAAGSISTISKAGAGTTHLLDTLMGWSSLMTRFLDRGLPGPEQAGSILAAAAGAPDLAPGSHLHEHEIRLPSAQAQDGDVARRLWEESARLVGLQS